LGRQVGVGRGGEVPCRFRLGFRGWLGQEEFDFVQGDAGIVEQVQRARRVFGAERVAEAVSYLLDGREQVGREVVPFEDEDGVFLGQAAEATPGVGVVGGAAFFRVFRDRPWRWTWRISDRRQSRSRKWNSMRSRDIQQAFARARMVTRLRPRAAKVATAAWRMRPLVCS
jgi:hypothetical protein